MRDLDNEEVAAISARTVVARDFIWVTAIDRGTGLPVDRGFWNDIMTVSVPVKDGRTGATVNRSFRGLSAGLQIGTVPLTSDISIRTLEVQLPHLDEVVNALVRTYDVRSAPMQLYRGYFDPETRALVAPAKPRFIGYVDGAPIETPAEGQEGSVTLNCVSTTRELTRTNSEVRSHESQLARSGGTDAFYRDTSVVGQWELAWGQERGSVTTPKAST